MKNFVKAMDKNWCDIIYDTKLKEGNFVGPQTKSLGLKNILVDC